jgi:hypothetical protein
MSDLSCPTCGTELDVAVLFAHEDSQRAFARLATVSIPLGARVLQYIGLFTPPKQRLTAAKKIKLLLQLLPDLERQAITHKGRDWAVPLSAWAQAMDQMLASRDAGRLELPMKGHGYLYSVLAGMADRHEATAEAQAEAARRSGPIRDTVTVRGQAMSIGNALQVQYAGKDPALAAIEEQARQAAPMPPDVRARLQQLKGGKP